MCPCLGEGIRRRDFPAPHRSCPGAEAAVIGGHFGERPVVANTCAAALIAVAALVVAGSIVAAAIANAFAEEAAAVGSASAGIAAGGIAPVGLAAECGVAPHIGCSAAVGVPGSGSVLDSSTATRHGDDVGDTAAAIVGDVDVAVVGALVAAVAVGGLGAEQFGAERDQVVAAAAAAGAEALARLAVYPGVLDSHPCAAAVGGHRGAVAPPTSPDRVVGAGVVPVQRWPSAAAVGAPAPFGSHGYVGTEPPDRVSGPGIVPVQRWPSAAAVVAPAPFGSHGYVGSEPHKHEVTAVAHPPLAQNVVRGEGGTLGPRGPEAGLQPGVGVEVAEYCSWQAGPGDFVEPEASFAVGAVPHQVCDPVA
ncbi:hypothetical protein CBR_g12529 [Chara braunii]|uniref:Uncharacterized protein n=1 Tax=Chara braunii TaxID=69332 RepID=A0A388JSM4_CHABU|nr:hypothetical protein CBR_g12529 [Chara braunii]|eukprot:GBG60791.1 hypothetical protein CBR_g12529 [Chara braunii]